MGKHYLNRHEPVSTPAAPERSELLGVSRAGSRSLGNQLIDLSFSRQVAINESRNYLEITSDQGTVELQVKITPDGPVLVFDKAKVMLKNSGDLDIRCHDLTIHSSGRICMDSEKDFEQRVAGNYSLKVRDDASIKAQGMELESELGELSLKANDDVALNGLRILMNVPSEEELAEKARQVNSVKELLDLPFAVKNEPKRLPKSKPKKRDQW